MFPQCRCPNSVRAVASAAPAARGKPGRGSRRPGCVRSLKELRQMQKTQARRGPGPEPPVPPPTTALPLPRGVSQPLAPPQAQCPKFIGSGSERSSFVSRCPSQTDQNRIFTEAIKIPGIHRPYDLLNMFLIAKLPIDEKISPVGYCLAWGYRTGEIFPGLLGMFKAGEPGRSGAN